MREDRKGGRGDRPRSSLYNDCMACDFEQDADSLVVQLLMSVC